MSTVVVTDSAREHYRRLGEELTGAKLGELCDRSASWGRQQLKALRESTPDGIDAATAEILNRGVTGDFGPVPEPAQVLAECVDKRTQPRGARLVVWAGFLLGLAASVAANVASASDGVGPKLAAGVAPVALLLAIEAVSRPTWYRSGWRWTLLRFGGTGVVALVAAVVSYGHQRHLLLTFGETALSATILPLAIDGLIMTSCAALLAMKPKEKE